MECCCFFSDFQGLTGPIGPPGPSGPNGEKVSFIYFHPVVGELKHYNVNSQTSGCQLIRLLCFLQGETGPAGPSGAPGTRGTPVCVSVIVHYQRR